MALVTGSYTLERVTFVGHGFPPEIRPLGPSQSPGSRDREIVVLPLGSPPPIWHIQQISNIIYSVNFGGLNARIIDGSLELSPLRLPAFEWMILPRPAEPTGGNLFGISVPNDQPRQAWFIPNTGGSPAVEIPVTIGSFDSSIRILPVHRASDDD